MAGRLRGLFFWRGSPETEPLTAAFRRLEGTLRVDCDGRPIELDVAGRILRLYPEIPLGRAEKAEAIVDSQAREIVASGGVGETAIWTEPLAYVPLMAIHCFFPWGAIGGLLGGFVGWNVMRRCSLSKSQRR